MPFSAQTVELLLRYIYRGADVLTADSVPELYYAANYLQIDPLTDLCEAFLETEMTQDISLEIWQCAKLFGKTKIAEVARTVAVSNFQNFDNPGAVGRLSLQTMKDIFAEPYLNINGAKKCKVAWTWLLSQETVSQSDVNSLIAALMTSCNVTSDDILQSAVDSADVGDGDDATHDFDEERIEERQGAWLAAADNLWIKPGQNQIVATNMGDNESSEWIVVIGGTLAKPNKLTLLNFKEKKWFDVESDETDLGDGYAVSAIGSLLYLTGGTFQRRFLIFNIDEKTWERLEELPFRRQNHCMVAMNNCLYVIGGASSEEEPCGVYKWKNTQWAECGKIAYPVTQARAVVVGSRIFLIGGCLVEPGRAAQKSASDMIQCYETVSGYSYKLRMPLPFKAKTYNAGVAAVGRNVYVIHMGNVYTFNENSECHKIGSLSGAPVKGFAAVPFGNKVLIFGGEDDDFIQKEDVLQYDVTANECVKLPLRTPYLMSDFIWTKITVPTSWDLVDA